MAEFDNLISYCLQLAVLAAAGLAMPFLMRLRAPRTVHGYLQVVLALCLLLPAVQPWREIRTAAAVSLQTRTPAETGRDAEIPALDWSETILAVLLAGVVLRLLWLAVGLWRLRMYRRRSRQIEDLPPGILQMQARLRVFPRFYGSAEVGGPVTFGLFRPVVLVPERFLTMDAESREAVACHELLHVRRRDWAITLAEEVIRSLFWFHPPLLWLIERIRATREQIVDGLVVRWTGARRHYVQALLSMASEPARADLLAPSFARKHHLRERVALLLKESSMSKGRLTLTLAVIGLGTVSSVALAVSSFPLSRPAAELRKDSLGTVTVAADLHPDGTVGNIRLVKSLDVEHDRIALEQFRKTRKEEVSQASGSAEGTLTVEYNFVPGRSVPPVARVSFASHTNAPAESKSAATTDDRVYRIQDGIVGPQLLRKTEPEYTQEARDNKVQGTVVLYAEVSKTGKVENIKVVKGLDSGLDANAIAALKLWKFKPGTKNGKPVRVAATIEMNFRLY